MEARVRETGRPGGAGTRPGASAGHARVWLLAGVLLCTGIGGGLALAQRGHADGDETDPLRPALRVTTEVFAEERGFRLEGIFTGRVQARRESTLGFERSGRIAQVLVDEGAAVRRGTLLAVLDVERVTAQRREMQAALAESEARLALATVTLQRLEKIVAAGSVSRQRLDEARETRSAQLATVDLARRRLESIDVDLAKARLVAPFDGIVTARLADEGEVLGPGAPLLRLQEQGANEVRIGVAGRLADSLEIGHEYTLTWRETQVAARLRAVLPDRSQATRTVDALFDPVDAPAGLRPGDLVRLAIAEVIPARGAWVPIGALHGAERGLWSLYVAAPADPVAAPPGIAASHRLARRSVEVLHRETGRAFVSGTLKQGELLVTDGLQRIVPGQWVRVGEEG